MFYQHHNWYIQKDLCLVHSKFLTAIKAMIVVCFLSGNKHHMMMWSLFKGSSYQYFCSEMQHLFEEGINQLNMVCPILAFGQVHCGSMSLSEQQPTSGREINFFF